MDFNDKRGITRKQKKAVLIIKNKQFPIFEGLNTIGRNHTATVIIKNMNVSHHHAIITVIEDNHYLSEFNSSNGTFLKTTRLPPLKLFLLTDNDVIKFADTTCIYRKDEGFINKETQNFEDSLSNAHTQPLDSQTSTQSFYEKDTQLCTETIAELETQPSNPFLRPKTAKTDASASNVLDIHEMQTQAIFTIDDHTNKELTHVAEQICILDDEDEPTQHLDGTKQTSLETSRNESDITGTTTSSQQADNLKTLCTIGESFIENDDTDSNCSLDLMAVNTQVENAEKPTEKLKAEVTRIEPIPTTSNQPEVGNITTVCDSDSETDVDEDLQKLNITPQSKKETESDERLHLSQLKTKRHKSAILSSDDETDDEIVIQNASSVSNQNDISESVIDSSRIEFNITGKVQNSATSAECKLNAAPGALDDTNDIIPATQDAFADDFFFEYKTQDLLKSTGRKNTKTSSESSNSEASFKLGLTELMNDTASQNKSRNCSQESNCETKPTETNCTDPITAVEIEKQQNSSTIYSLPTEKIIINTQEEEMPNTSDKSLQSDTCMVQVAQEIVLDFDGSNEVNSEPTQKLCITQTDDDIFRNPTQKLIDGSVSKNNQKTSENSLSDNISNEPKDTFAVPAQKLHTTQTDDDIFLNPTQKLIDDSISKHSEKTNKNSSNADISIETKDLFAAPPQKLHATQTDDEIFLHPTQKLIDDSISKHSEKTNKNSPNANISIETKDVFTAPAEKLDITQTVDEIFLNPTQKLIDDSTSKYNGNTSKNSLSNLAKNTSAVSAQKLCKSQTDEEIFLNPTQKLIDDSDLSNRNEKSNNNNSNANIFDIDTQRINSYSMSTFEQDTEDVFAAPTQEVRSLKENQNKESGIYEQATQKVTDKTADIENQLEVMFGSQNVKFIENADSRPQNPLANIFENATDTEATDWKEDTEIDKKKDVNMDDNKNDKVVEKEAESNEINIIEIDDDVMKGETVNSLKKSKIQAQPKQKENKQTKRQEAMKKKVEHSTTNVTDGREKTEENKSTLKTRKGSKPSFYTETVTVSVSRTRNSVVQSNKVETKKNVMDLPKNKVPKKQNNSKKLTVAEENVEYNLKSSAPSASDKTVEVNTVNTRGKRKATEQQATEEEEEAHFVPVIKRSNRNKTLETKVEVTSSHKEDNKLKDISENAALVLKTSDRNKKPGTKIEPSVPSHAEEEEEEEHFVPSKTSSRNKNEVKVETSSSREGESKLKDISENTVLVLKANNRNKRPGTKVEPTIPVKQTKNNKSKNNETVNISHAEINTTRTAVQKRHAEVNNSASLLTPERLKRKLKPKVVFTMLNSPELESMIRYLGGSMVDTVDACTVLVTESVKRSQKLLMAVGQGKPICSPEWIRESKKANHFLDPWDFILTDEEAEEKWNFSLIESLKRAQTQHILENYAVQLMVNTAADVLKGAIEVCGGKCVTRAPSKKFSGQYIIVSSLQNREKYAKLLAQAKVSLIVDAEAILDGVLRQELHFENHILT